MTAPLAPRLACLSLAALLAASPALAQDDAAPAMDEVEEAYLSGDLAAARAGLLAHAEAGEAVAQYRLGFMMATGEGGPPDRAGAIGWLEKALAQGHGPAALVLARVLLSGNPEVPDYERAAEVLQRATDAGNAEGQYLLGQLYRAGRGVEADEDRAFTLIETAARAGSLPAMVALAQMYARGEGTAADEAQAMRWLFQAADAGSGDAQMSLYHSYAEGRGFPQDKDKALDWLRKAAASGHAEAEHLLGSNYLLGEGGLDKDPQRGVGYLVRAAEKGHPGAQSNLAWAYYTGTGVTQDEARARALYVQAAEQGLARAAIVAGTLFEEGRGGPADPELAVRYYRIADVQGSPYAGAKLGRMIVNNSYDPSDLPETAEVAPSWVAQAADAGEEGALDWLNARAAEGDTLSHFLLGALYHESQTVPQDPEQAVRHMRIAAEAGIVPAQIQFARFHAEGYGVERSLVQAHVWTNIAASNGSDDAAEKRDAYAALMTPEEIAEAQERARGRLKPGQGQ